MFFSMEVTFENSRDIVFPGDGQLESIREFYVIFKENASTFKVVGLLSVESVGDRTEPSESLGGVDMHVAVLVNHIALRLLRDYINPILLRQVSVC